ncbi:MAG: polysaccharide biosynthesis protein [Candidatus Acidiferrales bacterium]
MPARLAASNVISRRTILLTGAGGSIGSALAKAILRLGPRQLILLDHSERNLNQIDWELAAGADGNLFTSVLGDISDASLLSELFQRYRPEVVYHAAAFKHVPLMESNPIAVVRNNALGTAMLAKICRERGAAILVMVSTDKAVNPISIMGASKRFAELALLRWNHSGTRMSAVRLGNVLASQGSVVPRFLKQISRGGPVTVTHPGAARYFFTIDEAVDLILLASALAEDGGIFVPRLGPPVKILDMALQLIADAAAKTGKAVPVVFAGLRPGDKLSEEFLSGDEFAEPTTDPRLFRVNTERLLAGGFDSRLAELSRSVAQRDLPAMMETLCAMVPDYRPTEVLRRARESSSV